MSILDSINQAEEKAAAMRQQVKAEMREQFLQAETSALEIKEKRLDEARDVLKQSVDAAQLQADEQMKMDIASAKEEQSQMAEAALKRMPSAVDFILERIEMQ